MLKNLLVVLALVAASNFALANDGKAKVKDVDGSGNSMILNMPKGLAYRDGSQLQIFDGSGNSCKVLVTEVSGPDATVSTFGCKIAHSFEQGDSVKISDELKVAAKDKSMATSGENDYITSGFGLSLAYPLNGNFDIGSSGISGTYNASSSLNFGARYSKIPSSGFGFIGGLNYEMGRVITSVSVGGSTAPSANSPTLGFLSPNVSAAYGLGMAYGYLGVNYSLPQYSNFATTFSATAGLGVQFGVGVRLSQLFGFEGEYRTVNFGASSAGVTLDYFRNWGLVAKAVIFLD